MPLSLKILINRLIYSNRMYPAPNQFLLILTFFSLMVVLTSVLVFNSPILILLIMIGISCLPALTFLSSHWVFSRYIKNGYIKTIMDRFIHFLTVTKLSRLLFFVYEFWHGCLTFKGFKGFTIILHSGVLGYLIIARALLYYKISHTPIPVTLCLLYIFFMCFIIIRFLTNMSFFYIPYIFEYYPQYRDILLVETTGGDDIPPIPPNTPPSNPQYSGWFNRHNHHHHYPPQMPRSSFSRNCSMGVAAVGLGVSAYACYHARLSALAAMQQAQAAIQANEIANRTNDIAALNANLISKDEYYRRHPGDQSGNYPLK